MGIFKQLWKCDLSHLLCSFCPFQVSAFINDRFTSLYLAFISKFNLISHLRHFLTHQVTYINGSPQNTFVPGAIELAEKKHVFIAGDDFKSGQTKLKSVLVDFLVSAGIKPVSIVSYNHLGNNDGKNLSAPQTFRSKEVSSHGTY